MTTLAGTRNRPADPQTQREFCASYSWSELYRHRRTAAALFGRTVHALPLTKRARDVLLKHVRRGDSVLEVGAGDRRMQQHLQDRHQVVHYESLDIDPQGDHDYHDLTEIERTYDCVFAFEVIEHLGIEAIPDWLGELRSRLRPGGRLLLSTPNVFYPPAYLRDATHRTPLCYDELAGLVEASGMRVESIARIYNDPLHRVFLRRFALGWLFRLLGIDFARQIVLVAQRPE